jgi:hypothetical protein
LFEKHDRRRFEIFGYSYGPDDGSPMRRRLVEAFDRFADLKDASFVESAERIAADEVDILVDLKGYGKSCRWARKICPPQERNTPQEITWGMKRDRSDIGKLHNLRSHISSLNRTCPVFPPPSRRFSTASQSWVAGARR